MQPSVTSGGLRATGAMGNCAGTLCKESCKGGCCGVRCACSCKVEMEDEELEVETPTVDASGTVDVPSITADRAAYGGGISGTAVGVSLPSVQATAPGVNISAPSAGASYGMPAVGVETPSIDASLPSVDVDVPSPSCKGPCGCCPDGCSMDSCAKGMPKCAPLGGCSKPEVEAGVGDITADAGLGVDELRQQNDAAARIQAGFRGKQARDELRQQSSAGRDFGVDGGELPALPSAKDLWSSIEKPVTAEKWADESWKIAMPALEKNGITLSEADFKAGAMKQFKSPGFPKGSSDLEMSEDGFLKMAGATLNKLSFSGGAPSGASDTRDFLPGVEFDVDVTPPDVPEVTSPTVPEVTPPTPPSVTSPTAPEVTPPTAPEVTPPTVPEVTPPTVPEVTPPTPPAAEKKGYPGRNTDGTGPPRIPGMKFYGPGGLADYEIPAGFGAAVESAAAGGIGQRSAPPPSFGKHLGASASAGLGDGSSPIRPRTGADGTSSGKSFEGALSMAEGDAPEWLSKFIDTPVVKAYDGGLVQMARAENWLFDDRFKGDSPYATFDDKPQSFTYAKKETDAL